MHSAPYPNPTGSPTHSAEEAKLLDDRLTMGAGASLGLSPNSPSLVGRLSAAYCF